MTNYFRPIPQMDSARSAKAMALAGGWAWVETFEILSRDRPTEIVPLTEVPDRVLARVGAARAAVAGLDLARPRLMGIVNVTPDSFSDGGRHADPHKAISGGLEMVAAGADLLDIGGESTRPGAATVDAEEEGARILPVIAGVRAKSDVPLSIDTRKAPVAQAALGAGGSLINDVSGFTFDPALAPLCAKAAVPVCVMHAQGDPATMQDAPRYDNALLDVYDVLEARVEALEAQGLPRARILVDPGIGFGKTLAHNLQILKRLSLFHSLGCGILLGVSRKRFIGTIGAEPHADRRAPGSIAVALAGIAQGVQVIRAHDVAETYQAMRLFGATTGGWGDG